MIPYRDTVSVPHDSIRTRVVTFATAKYFVILIETLFKDLPFLFIRQHKLWNDVQLRIATVTHFRPPYSPALVNGSSRKFYTWWTLSVIRKVTTWIFSWTSLNYRVGPKVTKFGVSSDPTRKLSALMLERGRIL